MRLALAQYPIERLASWAAYEAKLDGLGAEAAAARADLLVLAEYASMELASLGLGSVAVGGSAEPDLAAELDRVAALASDHAALVAAVARRHGLWVVGGTIPVRVADGLVVNRCFVAGPHGPAGHQDKRMMTRFEAEQWGVSAGSGATTFDAPFGRFGVAICYDSEFPLVVRELVEAGARLIVVPSCTDTIAGYHRVRIGCQARALENQCVVAMSPTVGEAPWTASVDVNRGAAGVFGPPDRGFPDDGVVTCGELDRPGLVIAEVDLAAVDVARTTGAVFNHRDWSRQG